MYSKMLFEDILSHYMEKLNKYLNTDSGGNIVFNLEKIQSDMINSKENINKIISGSDKTDLLSKISIRELFYTNRKYDRFVEVGAFPFIIGLCLNSKNESSLGRKPEEIDQLCSFVIDHLDLATFEIIAKSQLKEKELSNLNFTTQSYNMWNKVNYGGYQFQFDEYVKSVYFPLFHLFQPLGITPEEIVYFSNKIIEKTETGIKSILKTISELYNDNKQQYQRHKKEFEAQTNLNSEQTEARLKEYYNLQLHFMLWDNITNVLTFKLEDIISEKDSNYSKFKIYLNLVMSNFGDHNNRYCNINDHNSIFDKPIIDLLNGVYLCPKPDLLNNHHLILENVIKTNSAILPKSIPDKLVKSKKNYTENKPNELLLTVFPAESVYKNLYYYKEGKKEKRVELDNVILYDNYFIFLESKSGALTEPGLRGGLLRFKDDVQDIIKDGDSQMIGAIDYIQSTEIPAFYDNKGKEILKIDKSTNELKFIKIVLTLVPFRGLLFDSNDITYLNLFNKNKCLIMSIFDLESVIRFLPSPSLFINYLIQRLNWINRTDVGGYYLSETPFLHDYMKDFHFKDINQFSLLNQEKYDLFDNYHNFQDKKPALELDANFVKFLNILEQSKCEGLTDICNSLIELDKVTKNELINKINRANKNIKNHKKSKWFSYKFESTNYGLTYMVTKNMMNPSLIDICKYARYKYQTDRWYGINYVLDTGSTAQIVVVDQKCAFDTDLKNKTDIKLIS